MTLFWNFKKCISLSQNEPPLRIFGTSNSSVCLLLNQIRLSIGIFFKTYSFISFRSTINCCKLCSEVEWLVPQHILKYFGLAVLADPVTHILMYCNASSTAFTAVRCLQFKKGIGFVSYFVSDRTVEHLCLWLPSRKQSQTLNMKLETEMLD